MGDNARLNSSTKEIHRILAGGALIGALVLSAVLVLTSCSAPWIDVRPSDAKLRHGVDYLLSEFEKRHPQLVSWKDDAVRNQLARPLPKGRATEAGWTLEWPAATNQELSQVVIPWRMLGPRPRRYENDAMNYSGGTQASKNAAAEITKSALAQIRSSKEGIDPWFVAIVDIRLSKVDPNWAIFTAVPYLPVTDIAYGWAENQNRHWHVVDFGTALIGCGIASLPVEKEFGLDCPPA